MRAAAVLHRKIDRVTRRRPHRRTLPVINHGREFMPIAAIGIHQPYVRVFHGSFAVGRTALSGKKGDVLAVRRPRRIVLRAFDGGELMNGAILWIDFVNVVMKKLIGVGRAVRAEKNFRAVGRPVNGMLIIIAGGELANLFAGDVDDENVEAAIVVPWMNAFAGGGTPQIAREDQGIAAG